MWSAAFISAWLGMQNAWAVPSSTRSQTAIDRVQPQLQLDLEAQGLQLGSCL